MESVERALQPEAIAGAFRLSDIRWDGEGKRLIWSEGRSRRTTLVAWSRYGRFRTDLVSTPDVQARVGYGGGEFAVGAEQVWYVAGHKLYAQTMSPSEPTLVLDAPYALSSPALSPDGDWILLVGGTDEYDRVLLVPAKGGDWVELHAASDFVMQPAWHPSGRRITWISWDHPFMPWQQTRLMTAELRLETSQPVLSSVRVVDGGRTEPSVCFQPCFSPDGTHLAAVDDASGWLNVSVYRTSDLELVHRIEDDAEYAPPPWVQGLRSFCWSDDDSLVLLRNRRAVMSCSRYRLSTKRRESLGEGLTDYTWFSQPTVAADGAVALLAASFDRPPCVLAVEDGRIEVVQRSLQERRILQSFSKPRPVSWEAGDHSCHGLYYAPTRRLDGKRAPAVITIHGGPTSQSLADFDFDTQFFTTRGFAVLRLNYRGSTGYGRDYRRALDGGWGERDVEDVGLAARVLTEHLEADPARLVLSGGSAGGFTLLLSLIRYPDRFRAGICRFPVTDLTALSEETHKFERHYVDSLIGPLPEFAEAYRARSPLPLADRIQVPLALFQGDCDKVVPRDQSDRLAASLAERGVPHIYTVFPGEGHGWRLSETISAYYAQVEKFLERYVVAGPEC